MTEIYERNLNVSVSSLDDDTILTKASLLDLNHNIRVELTVDTRSKKIVKAAARMVKSPFAIWRLPPIPLRRYPRDTPAQPELPRLMYRPPLPRWEPIRQHLIRFGSTLRPPRP